MRIYEDLRVVQARLAVLQALVVLLVAVLVVQFWNLQVVRGAPLPRPGREQPLAARDASPRRAGALLDRNGKVLVGEPAVVQRACSTPSTREDLDRAVARLAAALGIGRGARSASGWRGASRTGPSW